MAEVSAIGDATSAPPAVGQTANQAFGLAFEDLLRIVLTQLTYQDPLKPMENFEFVSQLAQFSQIQQGETMSDRLMGILQAEGANQATSVLGRIVDIPAGAATISGRVEAVTFQSGGPRLSVRTSDNRLIEDIALSAVSRIAVED